MVRMIDQIRASKLPSNMMQFAARGALQVPPAENIEILVHLAVRNKVFGELARMTLAGWDEKACLASVSDPKTPRDVLDYFISPDNLRPRLLLPLLENPSVPDAKVVMVARAAMRDTLDIILKSQRAMSIPAVIDVLKSNPYLRKEEVEQLRKPATGSTPQSVAPAPEPQVGAVGDESESAVAAAAATGDDVSGNDPSSPSEA